jgi:Holliday junction resolvasome RuvABC endonuclease subunit
MNEIEILSVDPGIHTGLALSNNGKIEEVWAEENPTTDRVASVLKGYPLAIVAVEDQFVGPNQRSAKMIIEQAMRWMVLGELITGKAIRVHASQWQSFFGLGADRANKKKGTIKEPRASHKKRILDAAILHTGIGHLTSDMADAIFINLYAYEWLKEIGELKSEKD